MNRLLERARGLYIDRQRLALAASIAVFCVTLYLFYSPGIYRFDTPPPDWVPPGWAEGLEVVVSYNTVGFFLACALLFFGYAFWSWAFLPAPAVDYTESVLHGVFGRNTPIRHQIGKKFNVTLEDVDIQLKCRIRGDSPDEWFNYKLKSSEIISPRLKNVALRHGFSVDNNRLKTTVTNDELHLRSFLFAKAIKIARSPPS